MDHPPYNRSRHKAILRTQIGPFVMVPVRVLNHCRDARAIQLYAVLARYANREHRAWPKRERLAKDMGVSVKSIERAIEVLRSIGALETKWRRHANGAVAGMDYLLIQVNPHEPTNQNDTDVVQDVSQNDTGEIARTTPVSFMSKEEPDPFNQIQEHEAESERSCAVAQPPLLPVSVVPASPDDLAACWNETTTEPIKHCARLTAERRRQSRARLDEHSWETWRAVIARIERSAFCRGENARAWTASFGWLIGSPDVAVKVLEGTYDDRPKPERSFTSQELADAKRVLSNAFGCIHQPTCCDHGSCVANIIRKWRIDRGQAA